LPPGPYLFLPHSTDEFFIGGVGQNTAELRAIVVDQADVFDDYVVDLPVPIDETEPVV